MTDDVTDARIAALTTDQRTGHPVPWSSAELPNGRPDFTTVSHQRALQAAQQRLCGVCGQPLEQEAAFLGTARCFELETFFDPPMHPGCARASLTLCPHIAGGHPVTSLASAGRREVDGWLVWITGGYRFGVVDGRVAFAPDRPQRLEHYLYQPDGTLALAVADGVAQAMFPAVT